MIAARNAGATVFLAPAGNCGDVRGATPSGLDVVKVDLAARTPWQTSQASASSQPVPHC